MVSNSKTRTIIALTLNLAIIVMEIIAITMTWHVPKRQLIVFYTEDSNLFALAASIVMTCSILIRFRKGEPVPRWVRTFRYIATCLLAVTFLTVVFILTPMFGLENWKFMLLEGNSLYLHFLCPVVSILLLVFFERKPKLRWSAALWALVPTFVYGVILAILNFMRVVDGPYPFLRVYEQSAAMNVFWAVFMEAGAFAIAWVLWIVNRLLGRKENRDG